MKFNVKRYSSSCDFICKKCGLTSTYKSARQGCPACNNYLFKVALKNNPIMYDRNNNKDPYRLETNRPGADKPWKLNTPGSEETNPSGFGGRGRDGLTTDEKDRENKPKIPGSTGTMIDDPPPGGYSSGPSLSVSDVFTDPEDSLSAANRINRSMGEDLDSGSPESGLNRSRQIGIYDDNTLKNPFNFVGKNQRGAYR